MVKDKTSKQTKQYVTYLKMSNGAVLKIVRDSKPNYHQDMLVKR